MGTFAVLLHDDEPEANERVRERIEEKFPEDQHYRFGDTVYIISGPRLADEVVKALGLADDTDLAAVVLRLNGSYTGRSWTSFWDWMRAANEPR